MFYVNPEYVRFFFLDEVGNLMLGAAVALQLIGYAIIRFGLTYRSSGRGFFPVIKRAERSRVM